MTPARDPYVWRVGQALSQLGNAICNGNPDETLSSRIGRNAEEGQLVAVVIAWFIDVIFGLDHCKNARGK